jgi:hypothetical protein
MQPYVDPTNMTSSKKNGRRPQKKIKNVRRPQKKNVRHLIFFWKTRMATPNKCKMTSKKNKKKKKQ